MLHGLQRDVCGNGGSFLCDTWVLCGNRDVCGPKFGEVSVNLMLVIRFLLWFWWNWISSLFGN